MIAVHGMSQSGTCYTLFLPLAQMGMAAADGGT